MNQKLKEGTQFRKSEYEIEKVVTLSSSWSVICKILHRNMPGCLC